MAVRLFGHNQAAYDAAAAMLAETGRAAVLHPAGTGRSFIGFRLCADNPGKRILWLSPSEHAFKTQLENWTAAGGETPGNILFLTYAGLALLSEELRELKPDIEIFDDYHKAGAPCWSQGIACLRKMYPDVPVLGLSAADACYPGGRQDMAEELFGHAVASRMTLGEAIVRGILPSPRYVLSVSSCQNDLADYEKRIQNVRSKAVRDEAAACLEALRRALEKTGGPVVSFEKHMKDRHGKYIIFTPNYNSMQEYMGLAADWFRKIDKDMHIYAVGPDDLSAGRSLRDFNADDSDHLRLLYCIDALSGEVYAEDVSGVILLCPAGSPAVFRQQLADSLSVLRSHEPVIFDVADSVGDLYSIDPVREEMRNAVVSCRLHGGGDCVNGEPFEVIDDPAECRALFEQLESILAVSWDMMYSLCEKYYQENGSLEAPEEWITPEGHPLGAWLQTQRRVRAGSYPGSLTDAQIDKLDQLGMHWDSGTDTAWNKYYSAALAYYQENHHLQPLAAYVAPDGTRLGAWLTQLRTARKIGLNSSYLTPEHIAALDELGMVWDVYDFVFERNYHAAVSYYKEHGDLEPPCGFIDREGIRLYDWCNYIRIQMKKRGRSFLTDEQFRLLDAIGMRWGSKHDVQWEEFFNCLAAYQKRTGNTDVAVTYKEDGVPLGRWYRRQKELYTSGKLREDRAEKLLALGCSLTIEDPWEKKFQLAKAYSEAHNGSLNVPHDLVIEGVWLSRWLNEMRSLGDGRRKKKLTDTQRQKLASIGMVFGQTQADLTWEQHYQVVKAYVEQTGHTNLPADLKDGSVLMKGWLSRQLGCMRKGALSAEKTKKLNAIGIVCEHSDPFEVGYAHAKAYFEEHGDLISVGKSFICDDNYNLSAWVRSIRNKKRSGKLSEDRVKRLEMIGMSWDVNADLWNEMFEAAKQYAVPGQTLSIPVHQRAASGQDLYDWYIRQRKLYADGKLSEDKVQKLLSIGAELKRTFKKRKPSAPDKKPEFQMTEQPYLGSAVNG